jgi:hypothetical protein
MNNGAFEIHLFRSIGRSKTEQPDDVYSVASRSTKYRKSEVEQRRYAFGSLSEAKEDGRWRVRVEKVECLER